MANILVVEDTESLRDVICRVLVDEGHEVHAAGTAEEGLTLLGENDFTLVLSDLKLPGKSGLDFLRESKAINRSVPIIVMTAYGSIDIAVQAMKLGATDFITKPFDPSLLTDMIGQVSTHRRIIDRSRRQHGRKIVTQNPGMIALLEQARKLAPLTSPVLIVGASGTGKELLARYLHEQGPRAREPFVGVNCGSVPKELLESEFFGHEAGAFTGASETRIGLFEISHNGSIFLDEIGTMPHDLQVKLLRTLQESEIKRVGSSTVLKINTRVISATNCNIEEEIKRGTFRADLYYRLGVIILEVPPLKERKEDIALLAEHFIRAHCPNLPANVLTQDALELLESYDWPGNIREMENVIERTMVFTELPLTRDSFLGAGTLSEKKLQTALSLGQIAASAQRIAEVEAIVETLTKTAGNKAQAARLLGISYKTLLNKIKDYQIG